MAGLTIAKLTYMSIQAFLSNMAAMSGLILSLLVSTWTGAVAFAKSPTMTAKIYDRFNMDSSIIVQMPETKNGKLENSTVKIGSAENVYPDANNCFCFTINDIRSAHIKAFYFANKKIEYYNGILQNLGFPTLKNLRIDIDISPGKPAQGQANGNESIRIIVPTENFDETVLGHEIGHSIHFTVAKHHAGLYGWHARLFVEGSAHLLSGIFFNTSRIGEADLKELADEINQELRLPDKVITRGDKYKRITFAEKFKKTYPILAEQILRAVGKYIKGDDSSLDQPDQYYSSAVFTQPLWLAAEKYGSEVVLRIYFLALPNVHNPDSLSSVTSAIIHEARKYNPTMGMELEREFALRGIEASKK